MPLSSWNRVSWVLCWLLATVATASPASRSDTRTIEGVVVASTGPVANLEVRATHEDQSRTARTDARGHFVFRGLASKWWTLTASRGEDVAERSVAVVTEDERDVVVELGPPRVLKGLVRGADGAPLAGVQVKAGVYGVNAFGDTHEARTGADGRFELPMTGFSPVAVALEAPAHLPWRSVHEPASGVLEVTLRRSESLRGAIVDSEGRPVPRVGVHLKRYGQPGYPMSCVGAPAMSTRTDDRGRFAVTDLEPGRYTFLLDVREHHPLSGEVVVPGEEVRWVLPAGVDVTVRITAPKEAAVKHEFVRLAGPVDQPGVRPYGRKLRPAEQASVTFTNVVAGRYTLTLERLGDEEELYLKQRIDVGGQSATLDINPPRPFSLEGSLSDARGRPLRGHVLVDQASPDDKNLWPFWLSRQVPPGKFTLPHLPAGTLRIRASSKGYEDQTRSIELPLQAPLRFTLKRAPKVPEATSKARAMKTRLLTGKVETPDGRGLSGAELLCRETGDHSYNGERLCVGWVLPDGSIYLRTAPAEAFDLEVEHPDWPNTRRHVPKGATSVRIQVTPGLTLRGTVKDTRGRNLEAGQVHVEMNGAWHVGPIHPDGTYVLQVPPGQGTIKLFNTRSEAQPFSGTGGQSVQQDLVALELY